MNSTTYGHFDDDRREFVITRPATPFPWINYLGNSDFFALISNTAGGYAFYRDAKFRRLTRYRYNNVPLDDGGRYFYIYDEGTVWNPGWKPTKTALDSYECRHGMNYTRITGTKNGVTASVLFFVPLDAWVEVQKVSLVNNTATTKHLKVFSLVEWCLWNAATDMENFQRNLSLGEVEVDGSVIYHKTEYKERRNHYAYYAVTAPVCGFDTSRDAFLGRYNGYDAPQTVLQGQAANSVAHGWSPIASHCVEVTLAPHEQKDLIFLLGYEENAPEEKFSKEDISRREEGTLLTSQQHDVTLINKCRAQATIARFSTVEAVDKAFAALHDMWDTLLGKFTLHSGDERLNRMVNIWNQYQCMVTFTFSRSASFFESGIGRGMGFRDSNQDLVGFVHQVPARARQRLLDIASTQFPDGGCYHQYQPLTKRGNNDIGGGFNDDPMWLIFGTVAYIKETGDFSILSAPVPWNNEKGTEETLLRHLAVSFRHVVDNRGPHGLPLIGRADWNDCLNLNCFSTDPDESFQTTQHKSSASPAESLMIAGLFVFCGQQYAELCERVGDDDAAFARTAVAEMVQAVKDYGWDGEWFLRAYDYYGNKVGSHENDEGKIFIESQGWCTMAQIGSDEGLCARALDAVEQHLDGDDGIALCWPAYTSYHLELGEIASYPAGYKENAGIFCHNNPWVIIGEVLAGRGNAAWHHYTKICPAWITDQERHTVEPYVYAQMIAGKEAACPGEAKNSWLTGTAAWNWIAITQYILGIRPTYDGLRIAPCLPQEMKEYTVVRRFREAEYTIHISNPAGKEQGTISLTVDGTPVAGDVIPYVPGEHNVEGVIL